MSACIISLKPVEHRYFYYIVKKPCITFYTFHLNIEKYYHFILSATDQAFLVSKIIYITAHAVVQKPISTNPRLSFKPMFLFPML